ncbi:hypothetical protein L228DRAFT_50209 [Xylona heveae TC161]|uniref:Aflatoxin regulatory protein domain-containing protein n=1 Tax=Xylona heveae (strain CBS 132557 / TC161) TaxID=1328760 RepID=A0A164ZMV7_XYLHT|nr:hypothetical protein L228DRAFT_50209 [Xylona heveae TC161]KZF19292.1 hypothetical protein L228DRAFT_50209 [Xylona heveae TC161]
MVHVRRSFSSSRSSHSRSTTSSSDQDCGRTLVEPATPEPQPESHFSHILSTPPETPETHDTYDPMLYQNDTTTEHSSSCSFPSHPSSASKLLLLSSPSHPSHHPVLSPLHLSKPSLAAVSRPLFLTPPHSPEKRLPTPAAIQQSVISPSSYHPCLNIAPSVANVISLLEASISNFPCTMLQPDSTTIDLVRDAQAALHAVPAGLSLHRHPHPHHPPAGAYGSSSGMTNHHQHFGLQQHLHHQPRPRQLKTDLSPFQRVFPITSDFLRGTLYANIVAWNYITDLMATTSNSVSTHDETHWNYHHQQRKQQQRQQKQQKQHVNTISLKAAQTLGLGLTPPSSSSSSSSSHGYGTGAGPNAASDKGPSMSPARLARLERNLGVCVGRLMEAMCGKGRRDGDATLVTTVREVVRQMEDASLNATLTYLNFLRV